MHRTRLAARQPGGGIQGIGKRWPCGKLLGKTSNELRVKEARARCVKGICGTTLAPGICTRDLFRRVLSILGRHNLKYVISDDVRRVDHAGHIGQLARCTNRIDLVEGKHSERMVDQPERLTCG